MTSVFSILTLAALLSIFVQVHASSYSINCVIDGTLKVGGYPVPTYVAGSGITFVPTPNYTMINSTSGGISIVYQGIGLSTITQGSDNTHFISPTLNAGTGISLTSNSNGILINSLVTVASDPTCSGCVSIVSGSSTNPNYLLKPLEAGPSTTLASSSSKITIGLSLLEVGSGISIVASDRASLKTLVGVSGIGISSDSSSVTFSNTDGASQITFSSIGSGTSIVSPFSLNPNYFLNSLGSGAGIGISTIGNITYFTNTDGASKITLNSIGSGVSLLSPFSLNPNYLLTSLGSGAGIGISTIGNTTYVANIDGASKITLNSVGSGVSLISGVSTNPNFYITSLVSGSGIDVATVGNDTVISNTDGASTVTLTSVGGGTSLVKQGSGAALSVLSLLPLTGIGFTSNATTIGIGSTVSVSSVGAGNSIWASTAITNIQSKSLIGSGIAITSNPNDLTFTSNVGTCTTSATVDFPVIKGPACSTAQVVACTGFPTTVHACFVLPIYGTCDGIYQCAATGTSGQVSINFCSPSTSSTNTPNPIAYNPTVMWVL